MSGPGNGIAAGTAERRGPEGLASVPNRPHPPAPAEPPADLPRRQPLPPPRADGPVRGTTAPNTSPAWPATPRRTRWPARPPAPSGNCNNVPSSARTLPIDAGTLPPRIASRGAMPCPGHKATGGRSPCSPRTSPRADRQVDRHARLAGATIVASRSTVLEGLRGAQAAAATPSLAGRRGARYPERTANGQNVHLIRPPRRRHRTPRHDRLPQTRLPQRRQLPPLQESPQPGVRTPHASTGCPRLADRRP